MTKTDGPRLAPKLFAEGPARDARFTVVERWVECANFPEGHPQREIEFFHRQMNEEVDSLECSARHLADFHRLEWELRLGVARQCADEARHAGMFRRIFEARGGRIGEYPVLNFQYRIVTNIGSFVARLAIQNRSFEAGGLDAITHGIRTARQSGDGELAELFEAQRADEIAHVRFANDAIRAATQNDPRSVLQIGAALTTASKAFLEVMGPEGTAGVRYAADVDGRREAGFTDSELELAIELQKQAAEGPGARGARQVSERRGDEATRIHPAADAPLPSEEAGVSDRPRATAMAESDELPARRLRAVSSFLLSHSGLLLPLASHFRERQPTFESVIRGPSMEPTIPSGAYIRVQLLASQPCRSGDILFYLSDDGYMVHRVAYKVRRGSTRDFLLTCGDNRLAPDPPVARAKILGAVTAVKIAGRWHPPGAPMIGSFCRRVIRAITLAAMRAVLSCSLSAASRLASILLKLELVARACRRRLRLRWGFTKVER